MSEVFKKVLVITYYFPPSGGVAVQRTLKFVKYLREFGWEPVVLTAKDADYPVYDESLVAEIPKGISVYRSRILEPYRIYRKFTGRPSGQSTDIATLTFDDRTKNKLSEKISEWVRGTFFVPDGRIGWLLFASKLGEEIIKNEKIDVIYSSATPYTSHLIALRLHRYFNIPWVADFRDSWIGWHHTPKWRPYPSQKLEFKMEESVLDEASCIITATEGIKKDLLGRHPRLRNKPWQVITNGFDGNNFLNLKAFQRTKKFTMTYTGSLDGVRNPEPLICALELLHREESNLANNLKVKFVGRIADPILRRIESSCVKPLIEIVPFVTHQESLQHMLASDVLLILVKDSDVNRAMISAKLFEYIGAGRKILAIAPQGEATNLIESNHLGYTVEPSDISGIKSLIKEIYSNKIRAESVPIPEEIRNQYERRELTFRLSKVLSDVLKS